VYPDALEGRRIVLVSVGTIGIPKIIVPEMVVVKADASGGSVVELIANARSLPICENPERIDVTPEAPGGKNEILLLGKTCWLLTTMMLESEEVYPDVFAGDVTVLMILDAGASISCVSETYEVNPVKPGGRVVVIVEVESAKDGAERENGGPVDEESVEMNESKDGVPVPVINRPPGVEV
jgi:hypothetical protein